MYVPRVHALVFGVTTLDVPDNVKPVVLNVMRLGSVGRLEFETGAKVTELGVASSTARNETADSTNTLRFIVSEVFLPPSPMGPVVGTPASGRHVDDPAFTTVAT